MKRIFIFTYLVFLFVFFSCDTDPGVKRNAEYADDAFVYNGVTYYGREVSDRKIYKTDLSLKLKKPDSDFFYADGFFMLEGVVKNPLMFNYAYVQVSKDGTDLTAKYYPRSNFSHRIWLPFGKGKYVVNIYKILDIEVNRLGEGNINGVSYDKNSPIYSFTVFNTRYEDGSFLYPSYFIQSDDEDIQDLARILSAGKKDNIEIIKAVYEYVCLNCRYDYESIKRADEENALYRRQDAKYVFDNGLCVCEGYTSLTAALLRACGIRTKAVIGTLKLKPTSIPGTHAWLHVLCEKNGIEKYRLLDPTNDDNELVDIKQNFKFISERPPTQKFFLLDLESNENNNHFTHMHGRVNINEPFENDDGLYYGTRPWR